MFLVAGTALCNFGIKRRRTSKLAWAMTAMMAGQRNKKKKEKKKCHLEKPKLHSKLQNPRSKKSQSHPHCLIERWSVGGATQKHNNIEHLATTKKKIIKRQMPNNFMPNIPDSTNHCNCTHQFSYKLLYILFLTTYCNRYPVVPLHLE